MSSWRAPLRLPAVLVLVASLATAVGSFGGVAASATPAVVTAGSDAMRTSWYPDEAGLTPEVVSGGTFGQLFSTPVLGQVYAQPLVSNGTLFIGTEDDQIYGLDPATGVVRWTRNVGTPWHSADIGCADLVPNVGITATPVIDPTGTGTAYLTAKSYASGSSGPARWDLHAVDLSTGTERAGFPVQIQGTADNAPGITFDATHELQRPGLLLMGGVIYMAFGGHCDQGPYQGWVVGVSAAGAITAMWSAIESPGVDGAGIWQSGGGLVSDGPGRILLSTGNGGTEPENGTPLLGSSPPGNLGESVVHLQVQPDGSLDVADFFMAYNAANLDTWDADVSSSAPVALPASFGGPSSTPLLMQIGKQGRIYLLDRDDLGGFRNGAGGGDDAVSTIDGNEGVWARPAVWPGDGGYVWFPTASGGTSAGGTAGHLVVYRSTTVGGAPSLVRVAESPESWGYSSSGPVVTSNGTLSGSAVVWIVRSSGGSGAGSQLLAYRAVPEQGAPVLLWSSGAFQSSKFNSPGVGPNGRIYVGTRQGAVLGFGYPIGVPMQSTGATFPAQVVGTTSAPMNATLTATGTVHVNALSTPSTEFTLGAPSGTLPATLHTGDTLTVPVSFSPTATGTRAATLFVATDLGTAQFGLSGTARLAEAHLQASRTLLDFGGLPIGGQETQGVTFTNDGAQPLTVQAVTNPAAPFSTAGMPTTGTVLGPGDSVTVNVQFAPTRADTYTDELEVDAGAAGAETVALSASAAPPGALELSRVNINFPNYTIGQSKIVRFTLTNTGGSTITVTKSKPPITGGFQAVTALNEGTGVTPGQVLTEKVKFTAGALGSFDDRWTIGANDGLGERVVAFRANTLIPDPAAGGWKVNPGAAMKTPLLQLTAAAAGKKGTAFWPFPFSAGPATVRFTSTIDKGTGGDGLALILADAATTKPTKVGAAGDGVGFGGIHGVAVVLGTHKGAANPSANFVGISDGAGAAPTKLHWVATSTAVPNLHGTHVIEVVLTATQVSVYVDGAQTVTAAVSLPTKILLGFGATSGGVERHAVSGVTIG